MKKRQISLVLLSGVLLLGAIVGFYIQMMQPKTIEEILQINLNDVVSVQIDDDKQSYRVDKFLEEYRSKKYQKVKKSMGNTKRTHFVYYDKKGNVLFTVVDLGNQDLVLLKKGVLEKEDQKYVYQLKK